MKRIFTLFAIVLVATTVNAQSLRIGLGGGISKVTGPDDYTNSIVSKNGGLGFDSEYLLGGKAKFGLPIIPLNIVGSVYYHSFDGEAKSINTETSASLLSIGIGAEWGIIPGPVSPYVGLDFLINSFGDVEIKDANGKHTEEIGSRYGIGIGAGVDFKLLPKVDIDLCAKYNFNNLLGKDDKEWAKALITGDEDNMNTFDITVNFLFKVF